MLSAVIDAEVDIAVRLSLAPCQRPTERDGRDTRNALQRASDPLRKGMLRSSSAYSHHPKQRGGCQATPSDSRKRD